MERGKASSCPSHVPSGILVAEMLVPQLANTKVLMYHGARKFNLSFFGIQVISKGGDEYPEIQAQPGEWRTQQSSLFKVKRKGKERSR